MGPSNWPQLLPAGGASWPHPSPGYSGPISIREVVWGGLGRVSVALQEGREGMERGPPRSTGQGSGHREPAARLRLGWYSFGSKLWGPQPGPTSHCWGTSPPQDLSWFPLWEGARQPPS